MSQKEIIKKNKSDQWDIILKPKSGWFELNLFELFKYIDLITLFIKRDFVTYYKQTILGPLWYIIQPLVNTLVFTIIFGKLAKIPTDNLPPFLFYMAGTVAWGYFATCLTLTSNTFVSNKDIFGKVYFPRLTVPIANVIIALLQFLIQLVIFLLFLGFYIWQGLNLNIGISILYLPLIVIQMAILSLGVGIFISSLTAKYRDLTFAMTFLVQIWMYATPVVYPLSLIPEKYRIFAVLNPMTSIVESFRGVLLGTTSIQLIHIIVSITITIIIFILGIILFSKIEKNFVDTV